MLVRSPMRGTSRAGSFLRSGVVFRFLLFAAAAVVALASTLLTPPAAHAASPHLGGVGKDSCSACHVLHEATTEGTLMKGAAGAAFGEVPTCLVCHDGTGAVGNVAAGPDSFSGMSGHSLEDVTEPAEPRDLTNSCSDCHTPHGDYALQPKLPATTVNGSTVSGTGNAWCFACHDDAQDWYDAIGVYPLLSDPSRDATGYPVVGTFGGNSVYVDPAANAHANIPASGDRAAGDCLYCHNAHGSANGYDALNATFRPSTAATVLGDRMSGTYAAACFQCHDGSRADAADIKQFVTHEAGSQGLMDSGGHRIKSGGGTLPVNAPIPCYDCHNPHGSSRGNARLISDELGSGLGTADATSVRRFCLTCHVTYEVTGWDSDSGSYVSLASSTEQVEGLRRNGGTFGAGNHPDGGYNWLRLKQTPGHYQADANSCYECHGNDYSAADKNNVHDPGSYSVGLHTATVPDGTITILGVDYTGQVCADCHDMELNPEHAKESSSSYGGACATCHPDPRASVPDWGNDTCAEGDCHAGTSTAIMHAEADADHASPSVSCTAAGCHDESGIAAVHDDGDPATDDCAHCHGSGVPTTNDCSTCHGSSPHPAHTVAGTCAAAPCHGTDAMATHSGTTEQCQACHAPAATTTFACRQCHASPEHVASNPNHGSTEVACGACHATYDLENVHGDRCDWCHTGSVAAYTGGCQQAGCHTSSLHSDMPGYPPGEHEPPHDSNWGYCWDCHPGDGGNCMDCHFYDRTPPTTVSDVRASYTAAAVIHLTATDPAIGYSGIRATYYQIDGGPVQTGQTVLVPGPVSGDEEHSLEFWSIDNGLNTELVHKIVYFTVAAGADPNPPTGTMSINGGATYATSLTVTVGSSVTDAETGVARMRVDTGSGYGAWLDYIPARSITLTVGEGTRTVWVEYADGVGNTLVLSDTIIVDTVPPTGTMSVNNGDAFTAVTAVTVNSNVIGATEMRTSSGSGWSAWGAYAASKSVTLSPVTNGTKWVTAQYRDAAGNLLYLSDYIYLDINPPTGTMSVNNNAAYTTVAAVTLNSSVSDSGGSGLTQMRVDPGSGTYGAWIAYAANYAFTLAGGDGLKTVRAEYRDAAGNVGSIADTITYDATPPDGTMVVAGGAATTPVRWVAVDSAMSDATSGLVEMRVDPGSGTYGGWFAYAPTYVVQLPDGNGMKTVRAEYRDAAGLTAARTDDITLNQTGTDAEPPLGSIMIDGEAPTTVSTSVTLTLSASDTGGSGLSQMRFSNDNASWSSWEAYAASKAWTITSGDGTKTVYAQFRDTEGNVSVVCSDTIILYTAPTLGTTSIALTDTTWVDAEPSSSGPWGSYSIYVNDALLGTKYANATTTWYCPGVDIPAGGHIDIVVDVGFATGTYWDWDKPHTYTLALPAGTTRLEAATWTGFRDLGVTDNEWWDDYEDYYDGSYILPSTIGNIIYSPGAADTASPVGSITINTNAPYTNSAAVTLSLSASDTGGSGLSQMRLSNDNVTWTNWEPYSTSRGWTLAAGDGARSVYVQFADNAGNVSATASDGITLDTVAPSGTIVVNGGDAETGSRDVILTLSAGDPGGSGVSAVRFSNDNVSWSAWRTYATTTAWQLSTGTGTKTVYAQFRDNATNVSVTAQDGIVYKYTLAYTAGTNGTISGSTPQLVLQGGSGTAVTAVPDAGYHFLGWSDGRTDNPRTDANVQGDVSATAWFAADGTHTVRFLTDGNGYLTGGPWIQAVSSGGSTVAVIGNANWWDWDFQYWSDGTSYVYTPTLTLTNVTSSQVWTAYFYYSGSCPFLYTWDGDSYEFEADEFAAGYLGLRTSKGYRRPNPIDYHVLATTPAEKDGALEYKLVEERDEVDYLDQVKLYTVDAPADRDIYVERSQAEGVGRFTALSAVIHTVAQDLEPPPSVTWVNTGQDVRDALAASDGEYVVLNNDRNVGFTYQTLELDLGDVQDAPQVKLVFDGRTMIPTSPDGRTYSRTFTGQVKFEVQDASGNWVAVPTTQLILPKPPEFARPFVLDVSSIWISDSRKVRLTYLYKTYMDSILLDTTADVPVTITELPLESANLQPHGFNFRGGIGELYEYIYGEAFGDPRYALPGYYTRFGEVAPLLDSVDDKFVIFGGGDEITMRFASPGEQPENTTRRFLFFSNGYYKTLKEDISHTVEPLPFAAMSNFPYPATESYPTDADHEAYLSEWNTRYEGE